MHLDAILRFFSDVKDSATSQVRDHIEKLVESLVGETIDGVTVAKICQHPTCKKNVFFDHGDRGPMS
jgi:hypothetical protein